jgi:hypothetical protein
LSESPLIFHHAGNLKFGDFLHVYTPEKLSCGILKEGNARPLSRNRLINVLPGVEFSAGRDGGEAVVFGLCRYSVRNEISFGAGTQQTFSARRRCAIIRTNFGIRHFLRME